MQIPSDFISLMRQHYAETTVQSLLEGLEAEPEVSVRLNPSKAAQMALSVETQPVPWCDDAHYLQDRPSFTFDPLFHAGAYYVQEAGSMFVAQALSQHLHLVQSSSRPMVALDLCAAPGGKSTLLRSLLPQEALLVSNEPMRQRAQVLAENMVKWGHPHCVVTNNYPADFATFAQVFDLIVADVPCSGEGMFRKDEGAIRDWSLENVDLCWRRQRDIVRDIWPTLRPGGLMVYSTCTFNPLEDEDNVRWIANELGADVLPVKCDEAWHVVEGSPGYHFFPGTTRGEGFYMAVLRKHGASGEEEEATAAKGSATTYLTREEKGVRRMLPEHHAPLILRLGRLLHCLVCGVEVATLKGKEWIPAHALVVSQLYRRGDLPECALTYEEAIAYLRREALRIDAPRGYVVVTYEGLPLGLVKGIGNRANNLYPQEWRIRTSYGVVQAPLLHKA